MSITKQEPEEDSSAIVKACSNIVATRFHDPKEAIRLANELCSKHDNNCLAHLTRAQVIGFYCFDLHDSDKNKKKLLKDSAYSYKRASEMIPESPEYRHRAAQATFQVARLENENYDVVIQECERALSMDVFKDLSLMNDANRDHYETVRDNLQQLLLAAKIGDQNDPCDVVTDMPPPRNVKKQNELIIRKRDRELEVRKEFVKKTGEYWRKLSFTEKCRILDVKVKDAEKFYRSGGNKNSKAFGILTEAVDLYKETNNWVTWSCCICKEDRAKDDYDIWSSLEKHIDKHFEDTGPMVRGTNTYKCDGCYDSLDIKNGTFILHSILAEEMITENSNDNPIPNNKLLSQWLMKEPDVKLQLELWEKRRDRTSNVASQVFEGIVKLTEDINVVLEHFEKANQDGAEDTKTVDNINLLKEKVISFKQDAVRTSAYDYREILVPLLKYSIQANLEFEAEKKARTEADSIMEELINEEVHKKKNIPAKSKANKKKDSKRAKATGKVELKSEEGSRSSVNGDNRKQHEGESTDGIELEPKKKSYREGEIQAPAEDKEEANLKFEAEKQARIEADFVLRVLISEEANKNIRVPTLKNTIKDVSQQKNVTEKNKMVIRKKDKKLEHRNEFVTKTGEYWRKLSYEDKCRILDVKVVDAGKFYGSGQNKNLQALKILLEAVDLYRERRHWITWSCCFCKEDRKRKDYDVWSSIEEHIDKHFDDPEPEVRGTSYHKLVGNFDSVSVNNGVLVLHNVLEKQKIIGELYDDLAENNKFLSQWLMEEPDVTLNLESWEKRRDRTSKTAFIFKNIVKLKEDMKVILESDEKCKQTTDDRQTTLSIQTLRKEILALKGEAVFISAYDYREIVVPLLKSIIQANLERLADNQDRIDAASIMVELIEDAHKNQNVPSMLETRKEKRDGKTENVTGKVEVKSEEGNQNSINDDNQKQSSSTTTPSPPAQSGESDEHEEVIEACTNILGTCFHDLNEATRLANELCSKHDNDPFVHYTQGQVLEYYCKDLLDTDKKKKKFLQDSIHSYRRAAELCPEALMYSQSLAEACFGLARINNEGFNEVVQECERALSMDAFSHIPRMDDYDRELYGTMKENFQELMKNAKDAEENRLNNTMRDMPQQKNVTKETQLVISKNVQKLEHRNEFVKKTGEYWRKLSYEDKCRILDVMVMDAGRFYTSGKNKNLQALKILLEAVDLYSQKGHWVTWSCCFCKEYRKREDYDVWSSIEDHIDKHFDDPEPTVKGSFKDKIVGKFDRLDIRDGFFKVQNVLVEQKLIGELYDDLVANNKFLWQWLMKEPDVTLDLELWENRRDRTSKTASIVFEQIVKLKKDMKLILKRHEKGKQKPTEDRQMILSDKIGTLREKIMVFKREAVTFSAFDYREIVIPLLKSVIQANLEHEAENHARIEAGSAELIKDEAHKNTNVSAKPETCKEKRYSEKVTGLVEVKSAESNQNSIKDDNRKQREGEFTKGIELEHKKESTQEGEIQPSNVEDKQELRAGSKMQQDRELRKEVS